MVEKETVPPASDSQPVAGPYASGEGLPAKSAPEGMPEAVSRAEPGEAGLEEGAQLAALQQALEEAQALAAEYLDGWQRARAELSNARKRFQREQEQAYGGAIGSVLTRLLPIVDDFERAFSVSEDERELGPWLEGLALIYRKLQQLLDQEMVTRIEAEGQPFDPHLHQAITHEPSQEVPEGTVIGEVRAGYQMGDRVLRPALVRVSAGLPAGEEPAAGQAVPEPEA